MFRVSPEERSISGLFYRLGDGKKTVLSAPAASLGTHGLPCLAA